MSSWNVKLNRRKVVITVKKILQRWPEHAADFPGMEIVDTKGRRHALAYLDFICTREEWDQIREGSKIEITLVESVTNPRVILSKSKKLAKSRVIHEDILPEGDYKWRCLVCGKKGGYDCNGVEDPEVIADAIYRAHHEASSDCDATNVEVFNKDMKLEEELMRFVHLKLVKPK